ncbi:MAG: exo-alpha-sialidase [Clostridia bacterium]|nr:exo-alpha-sialidase [Clostridia bacterium]
MKTLYPKTEHGIVHRATGSVFSYQGWGTVARDEEGTLYAVASGFRVSHICPFGKTCMYISKNEGKTWSPPIVINDTYLDDRDAGILYLGHGKMLVTWFTHSTHNYRNRYRDSIVHGAGAEAAHLVAGALDDYPALPEEEQLAGSYLRVSEDYGMTWSDTIMIPVTAPHGPTLCRDGSLIYLGIETYEADRVHFRTLTGGNEKASLYRSRDGGYTWTLESRIQSPAWLGAGENLDEPHVLELPDGRLLGAFRIEGANPFTIGLCLSEDGGKSWGEVYPTGVSGSPPHLMLHSSGALICSYGRREFPGGERAMVSYDLGKTWEEEYVLHNPKDEYDWDLGYPSTVELGDGSLMTVYYQKYEDDKKCSMLCTKWRLAEK